MVFYIPIFSGTGGYSQDIIKRLEAERALKKSEHTYRTLANNLPGLVYRMLLCEGNQRIFFNDMLTPLTGYTADDLTSGGICSLETKIIEEDRQMVADTLRKAVELNGSFAVEYGFMHKKGSIRYFKERGRPIRDADGRPLYIDGVIFDVTDVREMEQADINARKMETLRTFVGGISHDFNNLFMIMLGALTMAMDAENDESRLANLKIAEETVHQASALTKKFLTVSSGDDSVPEEVTLEGILKIASELSLCPSITSLRYDIADDLYPVRIDRRQMTEVFRHVIDNACQAMPEGGTITISADNVVGEGQPILSGCLKENQPYVCVTISDEGCGIPRNRLRRIFDPYYSTRPRGRDKGMGLGLSLVHSIVRRHNGHIWVSSEPESGTDFSIFLPVHLHDGTLETKAHHSVFQRRLVDGKILVMDDESRLRKLLCHMLEQIGCRADAAADGAEAVALYKQAMAEGDPYDAVLLDLTVRRGMGGKAAMAELIKIDANVRAIISSGYLQDPILADYRSFGFSASLVKPYQIEQLRSVLLELIG